MVPRRNSALEGVVSEGPPIIEDVVPTPIFSGNTQFKAPNAISFASAATKLATPMVHGTLMADFAAEPQALRDCSDVFPAKTFVDLVITWPGFQEEWTTPMTNIVKNRDYISRAELAGFVMDEFSQFASTMSTTPCSDPEWRLGKAPDAYGTGNTCLAFLWSPAPGVWQPAFRVRSKFHDTIKRGSSVL